MPPEFQRPAYGSGALADLFPSVLSALGVAGEFNVLALPPTKRAVVLLIDGLGWTALREHAAAAPVLSSGSARPITVGFPTTTATSIASLGTGLPPGQHGITGYTSYVPELGSVINWLGWQRVGTTAELRDEFLPEKAQPNATCFERAEAAGVRVRQVAPTTFAGSGLTRAVLRGGEYIGTVTAGDVAAQAAAAIRGDDARTADRPALVYCYNGDLDLVGHVRGPGSDSWLAQLALIDGFVGELVNRLDADTALYVTADHGMAFVPTNEQVDFDSSKVLQAGVHALAGEGRARHVHTKPGAAPDVLDTWRAELGDAFWVIDRDEAIGHGLFGPVTDAARGRIGDVLAIARGGGAVVRRDREPRLARLPGQHGSLTEAELLVPLVRIAR